MPAGSLVAVISSGLKRAAADEGAGQECAWTGGESIEDIAKGWSKASHEMQQASTAILSGDPDLIAYAHDRFGAQVMNRAEQMVHAVKQAEKVGVMYRGMEVSKDEAARLLALKGTEFRLPLSSFSTDPAVAVEFGSLGIRQVPVFMEVHAARGLDISSWAIEEYAYQMEHVVLGNFRVVDTQFVDDALRIVLEPM